MRRALTMLLTALLAAALAGAPAAAAAAAGNARPGKGAVHKGKTKAKAAAKPKAKAKVKDKDKAAGEHVNFGAWQAVAGFADEMALKHGFPRAELDALFAQARYIDSAVQLVKPGAPGKPKNMAAVRALMVEPVRIRGGLAFWEAHAATLARAQQQYGVAADVIVGILGIETIYGRNTGNFRVVDVLATLGFAYPAAPNQAARMAFFRGELENTLLLARSSNTDPFSLRGSFAGAIGLPQFMPGSVLAYGVDFDDDGRIDLHGSAADAIGSIANFLVQHGWQREQPVRAYRARVDPALRWQRLLDGGLAARTPLAELQSAGVQADAPDGRYGLLALQNGADATDYWLATDNFYAITQYNRSYYYAMSVLELGRAVRQARGVSGLDSPETL
jgi:membrane-bound lytic murein transglycosylase B